MNNAGHFISDVVYPNVLSSDQINGTYTNQPTLIRIPVGANTTHDISIHDITANDITSGDIITNTVTFPSSNTTASPLTNYSSYDWDNCIKI